MKKKLQKYYFLLKNSKYYGWLMALINVLLIIFVMEVISGSTKLPKEIGFGVLGFIILINIWGLWKMRKFIAFFKNYVFDAIDEQIKLEKKNKK